MNKIIVLLLMLIVFSVSLGNAFAPDNLNTKSERITALQLNLSILDEANSLGLYHYGSNPAGILVDETRNRVIFSLGDYQNKGIQIPPTDFNKAGVYGLYGVTRSDYQAFEVSLIRQFERLNSSANEYFTNQSLVSLAFNKKITSFLLGVKTEILNNVNNYDSPAGKLQADPISYTLGVGWLPGGRKNIVLALSGKKEKSVLTTNEDIKTDGFGTQVLFKRNDLFFLTLTSDFNKERYNSSGTVATIKDFLSRGRVLWLTTSQRFGFGLEAKFNRESRLQKGANGTLFQRIKYNSYFFDIEPSFRFNHLKGLIGFKSGIHFKEMLNKLSKKQSRYHGGNLGIGFEYFFFNKITSQFSYSFDQDNEYFPVGRLIRKKNTLTKGLGFGVKINERSKLDCSILRKDEKLKAIYFSQKSHLTIFNLMVTKYF